MSDTQPDVAKKEPPEGYVQCQDPQCKWLLKVDRDIKCPLCGTPIIRSE